MKKKYVNTAFIYAIAAMVFGVFYREFTKFSGFSGQTNLSLMHSHYFVLGMFFFLIVCLLEAQFSLADGRLIKWFFRSYNAGLNITGATLFARGFTQVLNISLSRGADASLSGIAGIGHILLGVGIILYFIALRRTVHGNVTSHADSR